MWKVGGQKRYIQSLVGRLDKKRPLGRPRDGWEDNIKVDVQEVGQGGMNQIDLDQNKDKWQALVNAVMKFRVP